MKSDRFYQLTQQYHQVRGRSLEICEPLATEDYVVQPFAEVSPPKWHLGHTTWFFEQLVLKVFSPDYKDFDPKFLAIFNSYYKSAGKHWAQSQRGGLSRPTVEAVKTYRRHVDAEMTKVLGQDFTEKELETLSFQLELGIQHEQQHQELLLMDIKRILSINPSLPNYSAHRALPGEGHGPSKRGNDSPKWKTFSEGIYEIGGDPGEDFGYDNESPRHKNYTYAFSMATHFVSNGEYKEFMDADGYKKPDYWLSKGWEWVEAEQVRAPLYWFQESGEWQEYDLVDSKSIQMSDPVRHINYFEADAYARWRGCRLPTEVETEIFLESQPVELAKVGEALGCEQVHCNLWNWTSSPYTPYPGFREFAGKVSEYNGKFMCNQYILRGGCMATPPKHYRTTYRNFYEPHQRWMFSGIRLAKEER